MKIKKLLPVIISCATVFTASATAFALGTGVFSQKITADLNLLTKGEFTSVRFSPDFEESLTEREAVVYSALEDGISSYSRRINIEEAGYTDTDALSAFLETAFNTRFLWTGIDDVVSYTVADGVITEIILAYTSSEAMLTALSSSDYTPTEAEVAHALRDIEEDMTDVEKALIIHDYLVREVDYNLNVINEKEYSDDVYTLKGVFVDRDAVCQGYALAYSYLLEKVGIESMIVSSDEMFHAWNMVKINENWYHVDVTWDDPSNSVEVDFCRGGFGTHNYFLRSDEEMINELEHYGWVNWETQENDMPTASVSNAFDGWAFRPLTPDGEEIEIGIFSYTDDYFYCLPSIWGSDTMVKTSIDGTDRQEITLPASYEYLFLSDGYFYGSTGTKIHELNLDGTLSRHLITSAGIIRNFWLKQDTLAYYEVDGSGNAKKKILDPETVESNLITQGDFVFVIDDEGNAVLAEYKGTENKDIVIPQTVKGHLVTRIGTAVFKNYAREARVIVPEGVVSIGDEAFMYSGIEEIILPDSLTHIGTYAFFNNNEIEEIIIPKNVNRIDKWAFYACFDLEKVYFMGDVPETWGEALFGEIEDEIEIKFLRGRKGWTEGTWTDPNGVTYESEAFGSYSKDANGDGAVNGTDAAYLSRALANPAEYPLSIEDCDFNGDGTTDENDAVYLLWSLFKGE